MAFMVGLRVQEAKPPRQRWANIGFPVARTLSRPHPMLSTAIHENRLGCQGAVCLHCGESHIASRYCGKICEACSWKSIANISL
jgi:hypothetical protein